MIVINLPALMAKKKVRKIQEISDDTGIHRNSLTGMYDEKTKAIKLEHIEVLTNYFDCDIEELFKKHESKNTNKG